MDWHTREAGVEDVDRLALIGAATFLETFAGILDGGAIVEHCRAEHSAAAYLRYLESGATAWLAEAAEGAAPIGFALLGSSSLPGTDPDGGDLELKRIYSLSHFHGKGVGVALMGLALEHATEAAARRLLLGVYAGNARALAFYRKQGFAPIGGRRFQVGAREYDDIVLAKPLR